MKFSSANGFDLYRLRSETKGSGFGNEKKGTKCKTSRTKPAKTEPYQSLVGAKRDREHAT